MEDGRGCILLLCGIPGSGKTTLARKIKDYIQFSRATSLHVLHICFDDLIPSNLDLKEQIAFEEFGLPCQSQSSKTQTSHSNSVIVDIQEDVCNRLHTKNGVVASSHFFSPWKTYRNRILTLTDGLITALKDRDDHDKKKIQHTDTSNVLVEQLMKLKELNGGVNSKCGTSFEQFLSDFTGMLSSPDKGCECSTVQTRTQRKSKAPHVILVDDNMYYHSMRYQYFQLARKHGLGFLLVYIHCHTKDAVEWNSRRGNPVAMETIMTMATKLECPNPQIHPWERNTITIQARNSSEQDHYLDVIVARVQQEVTNPVPALPVEDIEQKEESRQACHTSMIHQADQVLRKCIAERVLQAKATETSKASLQAIASDMNRSRKAFLQELRSNRHKSDAVLERITVASNPKDNDNLRRRGCSICDIHEPRYSTDTNTERLVTSRSKCQHCFQPDTCTEEQLRVLQFDPRGTCGEMFCEIIRTLYDDYILSESS